MKTNQLIAGTCRIIAENYGKLMASQIEHDASRNYAVLIRENASDSRALRQHTYARIYPGIAVYRAMRKAGIAQEEAVWYVREYYQRFCHLPAKIIRGIVKIPGLYPKIPGFFLEISKKSFPEESGFEYRFPENEENRIAFDIIRCPYMETCRRYGCTEIVRAYCDSDDVTYGNMHPNLIWGRTKTIGRGGDCCDFRLTIK